MVRQSEIREHIRRYSSFVFIGMGVLAVLNGLFLVFANKFLLFLPEDAQYVGMTAHQISNLDPSLYNWAVTVYRLWGGFTFSAGVLTVLTAWQLLLKREKWAWYALAIALSPTLVLWIAVNLPFSSYFLPTLWTILIAYLAALVGSYWALFISKPGR